MYKIEISIKYMTWILSDMNVITNHNNNMSGLFTIFRKNKNYNTGYSRLTRQLMMHVFIPTIFLLILLIIGICIIFRRVARTRRVAVDKRFLLRCMLMSYILYVLLKEVFIILYLMYFILTIWIVYTFWKYNIYW